MICCLSGFLTRRGLIRRMLIDELRVELPGETEQEDDAATRELDERGELEYERRTEGLPAAESAAIAVEMVGERKKAEGEAAAG